MRPDDRATTRHSLESFEQVRAPGLGTLIHSDLDRSRMPSGRYIPADRAFSFEKAGGPRHVAIASHEPRIDRPLSCGEGGIRTLEALADLQR